MAECWFRIGQALEKTGDVRQLPEDEKEYLEGWKSVKKPTVRQSIAGRLAEGPARSAEARAAPRHHWTNSGCQLP